MKTKKHRDADMSKDRILDIAEEMFADQGYDYTSVKSLADAAGVSQGLIHHHFGSKEGLWDAVAARYVERFKAAQVRRDWTRDVDADFIENMMRGYFRYYNENPSALRFGLWSAIRKNATEWSGEGNVFGEVLRSTKDAQEAGILRDDISAFHLLVAFRGMVKGWLTDKEHYCPIMGFDANDPDLDEAFISSAINLMRCKAVKD